MQHDPLPGAHPWHVLCELTSSRAADPLESLLHDALGSALEAGLVTDAALCPDPQAIIERFEPEFQKLLLLALMLPWGEGG